MTSSVNRVFLLGIAQTELEISIVEGRKIRTFTLATEELNGFKKHIEYHRISVGHNLAQSSVIKYGEKYYVEGKITTKKHVDDDGVNRFETIIYAVQISNVLKSPATLAVQGF